MNPAKLWSRCLALYTANRTGFFWLSVSLIALLYILICSLSISRQPLGFDEGWDLQASRSLAENGKYASFGSLYGGPDKVLDPHLSTGPTTMIPVAVAFKLFGVGVIQARLVLMLFYLTAIFLIAWYAYERTRSGYGLVAPLLLLLVASQPVNFRLDILGEIPAIAYALGSLIAWHRKKLLLAGLFASLAVLSKVIAFFLIIAGSLILLMRLMRYWKKDRRPIFADAAQWMIGAAIPLVIWEIFKFFQLGGSFAAYKQNWHDYVYFFRSTGSGLADNGTYLSLSERFSLFVAALDIERLLLLVIILAAGVLLYLRRKQLRAAASANLYGLTFMALYLFWWFSVANGKYTRYIVPLAAISIAIVTAMIFQDPKMVGRLRPAQRRMYYGIGALIVIASLVGVYQYYFPMRTPQFSPNLADQQKIARFIAADRPASLTHIGWWQNPEIVFLGNLRTKEEHWRSPNSTYELLLSPTQLVIEPGQYTDGRSRCTEIYLEELGYTYCQAYKPTDFEED